MTVISMDTIGLLKEMRVHQIWFCDGSLFLKLSTTKHVVNKDPCSRIYHNEPKCYLNVQFLKFVSQLNLGATPTTASFTNTVWFAMKRLSLMRSIYQKAKRLF